MPHAAHARPARAIQATRPAPRRRRAGALAALAALLAGLPSPPADAVIVTASDSGTSYSLALRVGSAVGVDTVNFSVTGPNAGLTQSPVTGTPAIDVWVMPVRSVSAGGETARPVTLNVNSAAGLSCIGGGCGSTVIPFSKISWTASNNSAPAAGDIQGSSFTGGNNQPIASFNANATYCSSGIALLCQLLPGIFPWVYETRRLDATRMQFHYANDVIYPAGTYRGTVVFTATMN